MEKILSYKKITRQVLENHLHDSIANMPAVHSKLIVDEAEQHFILLDMGWDNKKYIHDWVFHVEISNGKVWIHEDVTDVGIAKELIQNGVTESDILLTFANPPSTKHYTVV